MDHAWPYHDSPAQFRKWFFDRLRTVPDVMWDESRPPIHSSYSEWYTWGTRRIPGTPSASASSDSPSSPSRSSFSSRPSTPRASSSDSVYQTTGIVARVSRHSLTLERQWQMSRTIAKSDPRGKIHLRALQIYRLPARDSHEPTLAVILYEDVGYNYLRDFINFGPNWYPLPRDNDWKGRRPSYKPGVSANTDHQVGSIHLPAFMDFAIGASTALQALHRANIIHGELRGDSYHFCRHTRTVRMSHLGTGARTIEGSLTSLGWNSFSREPGVAFRLQYVAPEQTGRTNTAIDARTDIYRLGILFWHLLTGELPYPEDTPLATIQNAFTRRVPPVSSKRVDVPDALSAVIAKMVAKNSNDRYHSAAGLEWDLSKIQQLLIDGNSDGLGQFQIASRDVNSFFALPNSVLGRDEEKKAITNVIERMAASKKVRKKLGGRALPSSSSNSSRSSISTQSRTTMPINGSTDKNTVGTASPAHSQVGSFPFSAHRLSIDLGVSGLNGDLASRSMSIPSASDGPESNFRHHNKFKRKGVCELVFVTGPAGVGKSSLVSSVLPVARNEGYCATARAAEGTSNPFDACVKLLANVIQQLFSEADISTDFHEALRNFMRPKWKQWAKILGLPKWLLDSNGDTDPPDSATAPAFSPKEKPDGVCRKTAEFYRSGTASKSSRFMSSYIDLLRFIADRKSVTLCLEELQFADDETVTLLEKVVSTRVPLVLVVTTRDQTEYPGNRERTLSAAKHAVITRVDLKPLSEELVSDYICEVLKRPPDYCFSLCAVVYSQTRGNMFNVKEMLSRCYSTGAVWYSFDESNWFFDLDSVFRIFSSKEYGAEIDDNYIRKRLLELSPSTVALLRWASLLGPTFSFSVAKQLLDQENHQSASVVHGEKAQQKQHGKVDLIRASSHDAVRALQEALESYIIEADQNDDTFRWAHVRFKQTAHSLCGDAEEEMHFRIAELLVCGAHHARHSNWAKALHTKYALNLIKKRIALRRPFRRVLYDAGNDAVESNCREKAMKLWSSCMMLLQPKPWDDSQPDVDYQETLLLYTRCAESYYYLGYVEPARGLISTIMKQARDAVDKVPAYALNSRMNQYRGDVKVAFNILKDCLAQLGMTVADTTWDEYDRTFHDFIRKLQAMDLEALLEKTLSDDRTITMIGSVMCEATGAAYWGSPILFAQLAIQEVDMYLKGKVTSQAGLGFIHLATVAIGRFDLVDFGCELALTGLQLLHKFSSDQFSHGRGWTLFQNTAGHICMPFDQIISEMTVALDECIRGGDPSSAVLNVGLSACFRALSTDDVSEVEAYCTYSVEDLQANWADDIRGQNIIGVRQWTRTLQGKTSLSVEDGTFFSDEHHDSTAYAKQMTQVHGGGGRRLIMYDTWKVAALFMFGHGSEAVDLAHVHLEDLRFFWSSMLALAFRLFFTLSELSLVLENPEMDESKKQEILARSEVQRKEIYKHSTKGNATYSAWAHIISAQIFEVQQKYDSCVREFEAAQDCAEVASLRLEYALATEMAAEFLVRRGANRLARASLQEAVSSYRRMSAWAKATHVQEKHEMLLKGCSSLRAVDAGVQTSAQDTADLLPVHYEETATNELAPLSRMETSQSSGDDAVLEAHAPSSALDVLDFQSILHSTQLLASELDFDKLTTQMARLIMDSTGAWIYGLVQHDDAGQWVLATLADASGKDWQDQIGTPIKEAGNDLGRSVVINALRYKETIVIRNTLEQNRFVLSEEERNEYPHGKAIVAMPIRRGGEVSGAVYLEGQSFTDRSITVLTLLVNAFAIAITNSMLFKQVEKVSANNAVMVESQRDALEKARQSEHKAKLAEAEAKRNVKLKEEAAKAKSMFLANVSHELRTPLNGVIGMSELLKGSTLTTEQEGFADSIRVCADTLLTVINDILDYSKLEAGKMQIFNCELSLYETINEVVRALSYSNVEKNLETIVKLDLDRDALVMGDPVRLHQVLMNLMSNSYKFTDKGSITVSAAVVHEAEKEVTVSISVADTGVGITEEQKKKLFLPFSQADSSTARSYGGTGLGLSICKAIIEGVMKGKITLESEFGRGTRVSFAITLQKASGSRHKFQTTARPKQSADPMAQYSRSNSTADENSGGGGGGAGSAPAEEEERFVARQDLASIPRDRLRVLVAEDNPVNQRIAIAFVKKLGFACEAHDNGREAVDALHRAARAANPFHIVLMDVQMPVLDGYDATREIRRSADRAVREVLVIAMTASAIRGDREKCLDSGMDSYLAKPVRQQVLRSTLERYIAAPAAARAELEDAVRDG